MKQRKAEDDFVRQVRINRRRDFKIEDGDQHAWAVSYSDLLMVLMSFFVLFFSFSDKSSTNLISEIAVAIQGGTKPREQTLAAKANDPTPAELPAPIQALPGKGESKPQNLDDDIVMSLKKLPKTFKTESQHESIVITLEDNVFPSNSYKLGRASRRDLDTIFTAITPYLQRVDVYFIGHTDSRTIVRKKGPVTNNFILSSMRANAALQYAISKGISAQHLFAQGAADNLANSRTLSVRIRSKSPIAH